MQCPVCSQVMEKVAENHWHCKCSCCLCNGKQYKWFQRAERKYCPDKWARDIFFKTGGLA